MVRRPSVAAMTEPIRTANPRVMKTASASPPPRDEAAADEQERTPILGGLLQVERSPVIRSKIQPPPLRSSTLSRQRLLDKLTDATGSRLTLVTAEAGYGKTTLLADFSARAGARCLWYRLDPTDADPITWTNYLIAAVREVDPSFGQATQALLAQIGPGGPPETAFAASFLGELPSLGEAPTILVLDDFHEVDSAHEARDYVARLLKDSPAWLHFVISARRRPSLELARLAGRGEIAELTTDELRFAPNETRDLFTEGYGIDLDPDVLDTVGEKTKGWAASLQLFQGSVHGRPQSAIRAFAMSLSGADSPMYDFLAQEVLNNIDGDLEEFLLRSSLLDRVTSLNAAALFPDRRGLAPEARQIMSWIAECDQRGLLTKVSASSEARQLHPLLRDFLLRALSQRHSTEEIQQIHVSLAKSFEQSDPLAASRHYIEAGLDAEAMACLERSTMLAMGSGRWGDASRLADRLSGVPAGPAVAAVNARRLIDEGDFEAAASLLAGVDLADSPPEIRASFRTAQLSLGWRIGDRERMLTALDEMQEDSETPAIIRDIATIYTEASPFTEHRPTIPMLGRKMRSVASSHAAAGFAYWSAIGLHGATIANLISGDMRSAVRFGQEAVSAFEALPFSAVERFSTHSALATAHLELGNRALADDHSRQALAYGNEFADVPAEIAMAAFVCGDRKAGLALLARAEASIRHGRTDAGATIVYETAAAFAQLPAHPTSAIERLAPDVEVPFLDFGQVLARQSVLSLAYVLAGRVDECLVVVAPALRDAQERLAGPLVARLSVINAVAQNDPTELQAAVDRAGASGQLAVLEVADAIADHLDLFSGVPSEIEASVARWPERWLPALRRQMDKGDVPSARIAARLLDEHGEGQDVGRLRAFSRTYGKRGRLGPLGISLAERVSPRLVVNDLGRVSLSIGDRAVSLATMRRKPASLLMYLVTRPSFTANREQVFDELWPDNDPASASNSLNQSLYFLRRELDPWFEDDLTVDYVAVQGELVWLNSRLVRAKSVDFFGAAQAGLRSGLDLAAISDVLLAYEGRFAPEFEYEEWAMSWRSRLHTAFLELSSRAVARAIDAGELALARDVAVHALGIDSDNPELERTLVWLLWQLGARAAAMAQYQHLVAHEDADGLESVALDEIVSSPKPT